MFCSTQINLPAVLEFEAIKSGLAIPDEFLSVDGREKKPHITVQFGLRKVNADEIRAAVKSLNDFPIQFKSLKVFKKDWHDVLYVEVADSVGAGGLVNLRRRLTPFKHEEHTDYYKFNPHVTLAYVRPGACDFMIGQPCLLTGKTMLVDEIIYSTEDRVGHGCSLNHEDLKMKFVDIYRFYNQSIRGEET